MVMVQMLFQVLCLLVLGVPFIAKDYQGCIKNISSATASRDLQHGVEIGLLQRSGDKRTAVYKFIKNR
jgi:hypothetical protein